ncbi:glycosyltransferase family 2 protein [Paraburkholderia kirstenboschensis]|uniref:glycosyltransferase family 2 protein n=1 Tax=Paraburkholderia kirstenboschensis TaxID=1245436 RepID=UPI000AE0CCA6|nr:glycosyltransferase family 2 protein [Paraburkholderia kirstenboschensis]
MIGEARGTVIAHFDDDDHYAPHYLAHMVTTMRENHADLIKLSGFFMYAPHTQFFGYMDLNAKVGLHYELSGQSVSHVEFHEKMQIGADFVLFYGFSYVYEKALAAVSAFGDIDLCDDESFIRPVVEAGRKVIAADDPQASCLHIVHPGSTSRCFSRHSMPSFILPTLFPCYEARRPERRRRGGMNAEDGVIPAAGAIRAAGVFRADAALVVKFAVPSVPIRSP